MKHFIRWLMGKDDTLQSTKRQSLVDKITSSIQNSPKKWRVDGCCHFVSEELNTSIWISNGVFFVSLTEHSNTPYSSTSDVPLSYFEKRKIYKSYVKWRRHNVESRFDQSTERVTH